MSMQRNNGLDEEIANVYNQKAIKKVTNQQEQEEESEEVGVITRIPSEEIEQEENTESVEFKKSDQLQLTQLPQLPVGVNTENKEENRTSEKEDESLITNQVGNLVLSQDEADKVTESTEIEESSEDVKTTPTSDDTLSSDIKGLELDEKPDPKPDVYVVSCTKEELLNPLEDQGVTSNLPVIDDEEDVDIEEEFDLFAKSEVTPTAEVVPNEFTQPEQEEVLVEEELKGKKLEAFEEPRKLSGVTESKKVVEESEKESKPKVVMENKQVEQSKTIEKSEVKSRPKETPKPVEQPKSQRKKVEPKTQEVKKEVLQPKQEVEQVKLDESMLDGVDEYLEKLVDTSDTSEVDRAKEIKSKIDKKKAKQAKKELEKQKKFKQPEKTLKSAEELSKAGVVNDDESIEEIGEEVEIVSSNKENKTIESKEKRLVLIAEGEAHMVEYFHKNKVYPTSIVMNLSKLRELLPYLDKNDDILIVIRGLTDFTLTEVYTCIRDITEVGDKLHSVKILSNIDLGKVDLPYYQYEGDLFYGEVKQKVKGKLLDLNEEGKPMTKKEKAQLEKTLNKQKKEGGTKKVLKVNPIMKQYKKFSDPSVRFKLYGTPVKTEILDNEEIKILNRIVQVDMTSGMSKAGSASSVYRTVDTRNH